MEEGELLRGPPRLGRGRGRGVDEGDGELVVERLLGVAVGVRKVRLVVGELALLLLPVRDTRENRIREKLDSSHN